MAKGQTVLGDRRIGVLLVKMSLPAFVGMFVMILYNVVDTIFIGHYVGPLGIAALSVVFPLQMFFVGIGQMIGMGAASVVSRSIGAGDLERASSALGNALSSTLLFSGVIMTISLPLMDPLALLLGASPQVLPLVKGYMGVILGGTFFQFSPMVLGTLIRAEGEAHVPMVGMVVGALLNVGLDALFIVHMGLGVEGAALGTVMSQGFSVAYFASYYGRKRSYLRFCLSHLAPKGEILKEIYAIGVSSFARTVAGSFSAVIVNRTLVLYGGDMAVSAFGIMNRLAQFAVMPSMAIGQGLQPVLGYNYGARRPKEALKAIAFAMTAATGVSLAVFLLVHLSPGPMIRIFTDDPELIALASRAARRMFLALYLVGFALVGSLVFQAIGRPVESFITSAARPALFMVPSVIILSRLLGTDGVWYSFSLTDALTFLLTLSLLIPQVRRFLQEAKGG